MRVDDTTAGTASQLADAYDRCATPVFRLSVLLSGRRDVAEEIVQETFVRSAGSLVTLPEPEQLAYLKTVALNIWRNKVRRSALEARFRHEQPEIEGLAYEERDALWRAIRGLPPRQRACLVLRYFDDLTERETATALGCSIGTVKSQTSRALVHLRKELDDADRG